MGELTSGERRIIALERQWAQLSPHADINGPAATVSYRRQLSALLDKPEALEYAPITVHYLRRKRGHAPLQRIA